MKHFTIEELTRSETAKRLKIDNTPSKNVIANLTNLVEKVLDPARERLGKPIYVNSGYRCKELNDAVKGARNSYHKRDGRQTWTQGQVTTGCRYPFCKKIPHTELIWEDNGRWIHVAL